MDVQVKGTSLPRALHCWDRSLQHSLRNNSGQRPPPRSCPMHLMDSCPWPHCNPTCPTIRDQLTGQEMSVIQFLTHMGFDVQRMAQQQGMEASTLLGMLNSGTWRGFGTVPGQTSISRVYERLDGKLVIERLYCSLLLKQIWIFLFNVMIIFRNKEYKLQ